MHRTTLLACIASLALAACSGQSQTTSTSGGASAAPTSQAMSGSGGNNGSLTIAINAQNGSGETGTATLTPLGGKTRVVIGIKGENTTGKQPAHIHKGTCAKLDPKPAYPLKDVVLGKSNTVVDVSINTLTASPMAINVHESAANIGKYVACGDIKAGGAGP